MHYFVAFQTKGVPHSQLMDPFIKNKHILPDLYLQVKIFVVLKCQTPALLFINSLSNSIPALLASEAEEFICFTSSSFLQ